MGFYGPKTCHKLKIVLLSERCSKLSKQPIYLSLAKMRENFRQNCTKLTMFVFVKSIKGCFQRGSFNIKHIYLSLLKDFYPFQSLKSILLLDQSKKETQIVKMLRLLHLMTFDPFLKSTFEHYFFKKNIFSMFFRLITISIQNLA